MKKIKYAFLLAISIITFLSGSQYSVNANGISRNSLKGSVNNFV
ncbi:hypothetical protein NSS79_14695 [Paenibacillus sp. FSL L8-0436]